ncbi:MAG TPA: disulfide bond formation protein B [Verrucomicrobiae bacterium]|nr:disulfide bond formation protein B [Verrucomicrobiae bacterium]
MKPITFRQWSAVGFVACVGAMAFALYLEHFQNLEPCPMCMFQRVAMVAAGLVFLAGAIHGPHQAGRWVYAVLAAAMAGGGVFIAARHVWLQGLPPDQVPACGPTLDYLMNVLPLTEVIRTIISGDGNCAKIDAAFLGVSLPGWTLVAFVGLVLLALAAPILARKDVK